MAGWQPKEHGINAAQLVVDICLSPASVSLRQTLGNPKHKHAVLLRHTQRNITRTHKLDKNVLFVFLNS